VRAVLVVEANHEVAIAIAAELSLEHEVLAASNLHEAFAFIDARDDDICAVVSGLLILSGGGLFQRPKAVWQRLPGAARVIVAPTDETQTLTGVSAIVSAGIVLPYPWPAGTLLAAIRRLTPAPPK
jgi:DNA-binding response OmpR family regulator